MKHCRKLKEYALFVNKMRSFLKKGLSVEISAQKTISECISQHILEDFLVKHRAEVTSMVLSTFDQENHDRILREYSEKIGLQKGEFQGKTKNCIKVINNLLKKGMSLKDISELLDEPAETVAAIADMIHNIRMPTKLLFMNTFTLQIKMKMKNSKRRPPVFAYNKKPPVLPEKLSHSFFRQHRGLNFTSYNLQLIPRFQDRFPSRCSNWTHPPDHIPESFPYVL